MGNSVGVILETSPEQTTGVYRSSMTPVYHGVPAASISILPWQEWMSRLGMLSVDENMLLQRRCRRLLLEKSGTGRTLHATTHSCRKGSRHRLPATSRTRLHLVACRRGVSWLLYQATSRRHLTHAESLVHLWRRIRRLKSEKFSDDSIVMDRIFV